MLRNAADAFAHLLENSRDVWSTSSGRIIVISCVLGLFGVTDDFYNRHSALRLRVLSLWPLIWDWIKFISESCTYRQALTTEDAAVEDMIICRTYDFFVTRRSIDPDLIRLDLETRCVEEEIRLLARIWLRFDPRKDIRGINSVERLEFERALMTSLNTCAELFEKRKAVLGGPFNSIWAVVYEVAFAQDMTIRDIIKHAARRIKHAMELDNSTELKLRLIYLNVRFLRTLSCFMYHRGEEEIYIVNQSLLREHVVELALDNIGLAMASFDRPTPVSSTIHRDPLRIDVLPSLLVFALYLLLNILRGEHGVSSVRKALRHSPGLIHTLASVTMPSSPITKLGVFNSLCTPIREILNVVLVPNLRFVSVLSVVHAAIAECPSLVTYCEDICTTMRKSMTLGLSAADKLSSLALCWGILYIEVKHQNAAFERLSEDRKHEIVPCSNVSVSSMLGHGCV